MMTKTKTTSYRIVVFDVTNPTKGAQEVDVDEPPWQDLRACQIFAEHLVARARAHKRQWRVSVHHIGDRGQVTHSQTLRPGGTWGQPIPVRSR